MKGPFRSKFFLSPAALVGSVLVCLVALVAFIPVAAHAATSQTVTFHNVPVPFGITDCSGNALTGIITFNGIAHFNTSSSGTSNDQFTGTGDAVFTIADGVTFTGHITLWDDGVMTAGGAAVFSFIGETVLVGSDGSRLSEHFVSSMTVTPAGDITSAFIHFVCQAS
ncbi:MAG TPA: hypothetical protein VF043_33360 [Ktedonobacteraceae bacterium]